MGSVDVNESCLFDRVVRTKRSLAGRRRSCSFSRSLEMDVVAGKGSERVDGKLRPGKEVNKTLIIDDDAMALESLFWVLWE